ncbi:hypothetical protein ABZX62_26910 [Streptomyces flavidovirens]|uniref:hypothetical protein n=1 Tax=Streptomyces flavidovirens TaxID=67298 RepID=UPI0033A2120C
MNAPHLPEPLVRKRLDAMLLACENEGTRPSVLRLARSLGLSNTTFRRQYREIAQEISGRRSAPTAATASEPSAYDNLIARNAKIRRRNHQLTDQLKLAAAQIQYLALQNARLQEALEAQTKVTHIDSKGRRR